MVFNTTFNNISAIISGGNRNTPKTTASYGQTLSRNVVSSTPCLSGIRTHNFSGDRH